ncbi:uncharacterized protein CMU_033800 [Cryptosporidium muris RN66]|uniref:Ubiquitin-like domain-containing protein n=1 Tax=Cryptosporidium muris (strain RN66) TaxID=441375 RepID=B6AFK4_CRYMR|nr:uncharacterized protein CMU_033800 [Cryptosporidium muris RN66]EEA06995.1 hypothetical protein, conserved [Cryptosporidium muris RN66]|eukprot:XP_002141344.1 hypothetical protein [Cryptosporidium muris RN66]
MCDAGLKLPPNNEKLQREEEEVMHGANLTLKLNFPQYQSEVEELSVKSSTEVGYVKLLIGQRKGITAKNIRIFYNGTQMIDPMSLCDHLGVSPPSIDVDVYINLEHTIDV